MGERAPGGEGTAERRHEPAARRVDDVTLGLGLTRLGRPWGVRPSPVPSDQDAERFLADAVALGVRTFDTAPSYGSSERRLGRLLSTLAAARRADLFVATKFGEWWDAGSGAITVDHSYDALCRSLDASLAALGQVQLIQLHRPDTAALRSRDVARACAHARAMGVAHIGASVSRVEDARVALDALGVEWLQFPYHLGNTYMEEAFLLAAGRGARVLVNRPFGMGALVGGGGRYSAEDALRGVCAHPFRGAVLTGTISTPHLRENLAALERVRRDAAGG